MPHISGQRRSCSYCKLHCAPIGAAAPVHLLKLRLHFWKGAHILQAFLNRLVKEYEEALRMPAAPSVTEATAASGLPQAARGAGPAGRASHAPTPASDPQPRQFAAQVRAESATLAAVHAQDNVTPSTGAVSAGPTAACAGESHISKAPVNVIIA